MNILAFPKRYIEFIKSIGFQCVDAQGLSQDFKMPVQNSNFKISTRPDLATNLLQILIPATIDSLMCQKGQFTLQPGPR